MNSRKCDNVIYVNKTIPIRNIDEEHSLVYNEEKFDYKDALFFDLEHYVYRKPIAIGVFGCAYYEEENNSIELTQIMIEKAEEADDILLDSLRYFKYAKEKLHKKYIVTFSGDNDFFMFNTLIKEKGINYILDKQYKSIDIQKEFQKKTNEGIGLKSLEILFNINRECESISGVQIAKSFGKYFKENSNYKMSKKKANKILRYNEEDVVNLFYIAMEWQKYIDDINVENIVEAREKCKSQS